MLLDIIIKPNHKWTRACRLVNNRQIKIKQITCNHDYSLPHYLLFLIITNLCFRVQTNSTTKSKNNSHFSCSQEQIITNLCFQKQINSTTNFILIESQNQQIIHKQKTNCNYELTITNFLQVFNNNRWLHIYASKHRYIELQTPIR